MASIGGGDLVHASSFYTIDADADITEGETLVIAGKTYTFNATLGSSDGDVQLGAAGAHQLSIANIVAAINLDPAGSGVQYAAAMTRNPRVWAVEGDNTLTIYALLPGTQGNLIPLTVGTSAAAVDNATLENGAGDIGAFFDSLFDLNQINAELLLELKRLTPQSD
jgi:hypothetical protein